MMKQLYKKVLPFIFVSLIGISSQAQKIFDWSSTQVNPADKDISAEEFTKMMETHKH